MTVVGFVIKLSPYSITLHDTKVCGRVEIPNFGTDAGEGAASHTGNRRVRCKVNPQAGTELVQKKKIHLADIEPRFLWYS
jgi:hypothetical protein